MTEALSPSLGEESFFEERPRLGRILDWFPAGSHSDRLGSNEPRIHSDTD